MKQKSQTPTRFHFPCISVLILRRRRKWGRLVNGNCTKVKKQQASKKTQKKKPFPLPLSLCLFVSSKQTVVCLFVVWGGEISLNDCTKARDFGRKMAGSSDRSKEAVGMVALHEALRSVCLNSEWTYSVFWTIRPRPRLRGGGGCKVGDDNGSLMLMWEDGFCRGRVADGLNEVDEEDPVRKAFSKMSIQLYNYGEGLMGKVAADKCHKWVFKEPAESEPNVSNSWQSSFDALPSEWTDQFEAGIQTIAVIQAGHGLLQLGSCKIITENLHFVLRMRHTIESLGYQSGVYLSQLFSSTRNASSPSTVPSTTISSSSTLFNYGLRPLVSPASVLASPEFQSTGRYGIPSPSHKLYLPPYSTESSMEDLIGEHENDIKWPNGLSIFNVLAGQSDESAKLMLNPEGIQNDSLAPDSQLKMDNNFHRGFGLPSRTTAAPSSTSHNHHTNNPGEYRNESGMFNGVMKTL